MASICCSPPLRLPACWCAGRPGGGRRSNHRVDVGGDLLVLADVGTDSRLSSHAELGERAPALGHVGDARGARRVGGGAPINACRPGRRGRGVLIIWQIARIVVVLPAPLAPRITTTSPSFTSKVDAVEHLHGP